MMPRMEHHINARFTVMNKIFSVVLLATSIIAIVVFSGCTSYTPEHQKAQANQSSEIIEAILADGHLEKRVKERISAKATGDLKSLYEMEHPSLRQYLSFLEQQQQESKPKLIDADLEKICHCGLVVDPDGIQTLRCTLLVDVSVEDEGHLEQIRILEMWESVDGEWYHGYTDHHFWENCPNN